MTESLFFSLADADAWVGWGWLYKGQMEVALLKMHPSTLGDGSLCPARFFYFYLALFGSCFIPAETWYFTGKMNLNIGQRKS